MGSKNELLDDLQDALIPKTEPNDVDSIKKEEIEEDVFVAPGILEPLEINKDSVKEEISLNEGLEPCPESPGIENEEEEPCSSSDVRIIFLIISSFSFKNHISATNFLGTPTYHKNYISDVLGNFENLVSLCIQIFKWFQRLTCRPKVTASILA